MATIDVKDAAGTTRTIQAPNSNGRAAAAESRPVAVAAEDLAAINAITTALANVAVASKQDTANASLAAIANVAVASKQDTGNATTSWCDIFSLSQCVWGTVGANSIRSSGENSAPLQFH